MSDADNTLKIGINLETTGLEGAEEARKGVGDTAEKTRTLGKETEEAGQKAAEANHHHGSTRMIFSELNKIVPGLGHALHAMFSGPLGAVILMSVAIEEVHKALKEYNDELDKEGQDAYAPHLESLEVIKKSWDEATSHQAAYIASLATIGGDEDPIAKHIKFLKEMDKAKFGGADPNIDRNLQWEEWKERSADLPGAQTAQAAASKTAQAASTKPELLKQERDRLEKEQADQQKKIDDARKTLEHDKWMYDHFIPLTNPGAYAPGMTDDVFIKQSQDHLENLEAQQRNGRTRLGQLPGEITSASDASAIANEQLKNAETRVKRDETRMHEIPEDLRSGAALQNQQEQTKTMLAQANAALGLTHESFQQYAAAAGLTQQQIKATIDDMLTNQAEFRLDLQRLKDRHDRQGQ